MNGVDVLGLDNFIVFYNGDDTFDDENDLIADSDDMIKGAKTIARVKFQEYLLNNYDECKTKYAKFYYSSGAGKPKVSTDTDAFRKKAEDFIIDIRSIKALKESLDENKKKWNKKLYHVFFVDHGSSGSMLMGGKITDEIFDRLDGLRDPKYFMEVVFMGCSVSGGKKGENYLSKLSEKYRMMNFVASNSTVTSGKCKVSDWDRWANGGYWQRWSTGKAERLKSAYYPPRARSADISPLVKVGKYRENYGDWYLRPSKDDATANKWAFASKNMTFDTWLVEVKNNSKPEPKQQKESPLFSDEVPEETNQ